jgi:hypothetical protein
MSYGLARPREELQSGPGARFRDLTLAVFRIAVGLYWLWEQRWKLPPDFGLNEPRGLMGLFRESAEKPLVGIIGTFVREVVIPNALPFAWLLFFVEVIIGISLVLGLLTRGGALMGTLQALILLLGGARLSEGPLVYLLILFVNAFVLLTPCNRELSVDRSLAPRLADDASRGSGPSRALLRLM